MVESLLLMGSGSSSVVADSWVHFGRELQRLQTKCSGNSDDGSGFLCMSGRRSSCVCFLGGQEPAQFQEASCSQSLEPTGRR